MDTHVGNPIASRCPAPDCSCRSKLKEERKCDRRSEERRGKHVRSEEKDKLTGECTRPRSCVARRRAVPAGLDPNFKSSVSSHPQAGAQRGGDPNAPRNDTRQSIAKTPKGWQDLKHLALPCLHLVKAKIFIGRHCRDSFLWRYCNVLESTREKGPRRTDRTAVCVFEGCS